MEIYNIPDNWNLLRIAGRKHREVVSHIQIEGDKTLCGRDSDGMVFDDIFIFMPPMHVFGIYGGIQVVHKLCSVCLRKAIE